MKLLFTIFSLILVSVYGNLSVIPLPIRNSRIHDICGKNEIFMECGKNCQTECPTLYQPCLIRQHKCPSGCYCIEGYARETKHGRCIPISKCPNNYYSYSGSDYKDKDHYSQKHPQKQLPPYYNNNNHNSEKENMWPFQLSSLGELHTSDSQAR